MYVKTVVNLPRHRAREIVFYAAPHKKGRRFRQGDEVGFFWDKKNPAHTPEKNEKDEWIIGKYYKIVDERLIAELEGVEYTPEPTIPTDPNLTDNPEEDLAKLEAATTPEPAPAPDTEEKAKAKLTLNKR